ncbi:MAG: hypothetical protein OXL41_15530 [Nitrospinae bacterium]|nr:hypothetical protein [Nitrospinota bacterium]
MPIGADLSARYTEEAIGGGHPTKARVIDRLALAALFPDGKIRANRQPIECAGRLDYVNATTLAFRPTLGSAYCHAVANPVAGRHVPFIDESSGDVYYEDLPWEGITITNADLAADRSYAVFVYDDGGGLKLEYDDSGSWAFDAATGLAHKTDEKSRTLVGIARTDASSRFVLANDVYVRSFWNKAEYAAPSKGTLATTLSTDWTSVATHEILMWPGHDVIRQEAGGQGWVNSSYVAGLVGLDIDLELYGGADQAYPEVEFIRLSNNEKDNFSIARTRIYTGALAEVHSTFVFRVAGSTILNIGDYLFQSVVLI